MEKALSAIRNSNAQVRRAVLENGMICLVKEDHSAPVVSVQIWVGTGSIDEQEYLGGGLSHYVEHMIFKGTPTRPLGEITRQINNAGGSINAYTSHDRTVFHTELPGTEWRVGVDVLSDAVLNPAFPQDEWQKEKDVILREFAMGNDDPHHVIDKMLWRTSFLVHPYRFPVIGYADVFRTMTRDDLMKFFHRNYVPDNMIAVVVGDVSADEVMAALRDTFAAVPRRARAPVVLPAEPRQIAPRLTHDTGAYNMSRLAWAYHTVALNDPDAPSLDVLAAVTGQGQSSRLVQEIKEKLKLVHSIDAWSYTPKEPGLFGLSASFDPDKEDEVVRAVQAEVDHWLKNGFSSAEIEKAKRSILTSTLSALQTMSGQANEFASGEFYAGTPAFSEIYLKRLQDITPQSLKATAARYLTERNRSIVILAPASGTPKSKAMPTATAAEMKKLMLSRSHIPLLVREDHRLPFVCFSVVMGGGLLAESATNNGITHLMAELLIRGTRTRTELDIASQAESLGGSLSAFSGQNSFGLQAKCLSSDAETFMDLIADCILHPSFSEEEMAKQKTVQLAALAEQNDRPMYVAQTALRQTLFPEHPYRWDPLGSSNTVNAITREALLQHFRTLVVSGNMVVTILGDVTPDIAQKLAENGLKDVPPGTAPEWPSASPAPKLPARNVISLPREQAILLAGFPGVNLKDSRRDALEMLQTAMSGLSSEIGNEVREKRGLAYYVGAYQQANLAGGMFVIYAGTQAKAVAEVEGLFSNEIKRVTAQGLSEEEIDRARREIIAHHDMMLQDDMDVGMVCALNELYGLGYRYLFSAKERFAAVTPAAIRDAAASILLTSRQATCIVKPEKVK